MTRLLLLFAVAGCWKSGGASHGPVPTSLEASAHDPTGPYWCSIDDEKSLEFRCEIAKRGSSLRLEKVSGAERIRGDDFAGTVDSETALGTPSTLRCCCN